MPSTASEFLLRRREVVGKLLHDRGDRLVIGGLGSTAWDITAAGDHDLSFPLWGAMGGTVAIGIGLATAQPDRRVLVVTGDGDMLMGMGSLATAARQNLKNLTVCVFDNEHYGETGMQTTHTASGTNLAAIAAGCGFANSRQVETEDQLTEALPLLRDGPGLQFVCIKVRAEKLAFVLPPKDGVFLKTRFRRALLGADVV
ncbi:MAG: aldehyde dehydrogenase [Rhodospirillales bacterium]|nr:aldehyde dehydrogenase [Rhodospirillales bacterium]